MRSRKRRPRAKSQKKTTTSVPDNASSPASQQRGNQPAKNIATPQTTMLRMQRLYGNDFVRRQIVQRDPFGITETMEKVTGAVSGGAYLAQRKRLLSEMREITRQEISRHKKRRQIIKILNTLTDSQKKRLAKDEDLLTQIRHMVSTALYNEIKDDINNLAGGGTITDLHQDKGGTLTIIEGPWEAVELEELDPDLVDLELDLRDPARQQEIAGVVQQVKTALGATKQMTAVLNEVHGGAVDDAIKNLPERGQLLGENSLGVSVGYAHTTLGLVDKVLTVADSQERQEYLKKLKASWGHGKAGKTAVLTEVLKTGVEGVKETVSVGALIAYGVAKVSGNQGAIQKATGLLTKATQLKVLKYAGPVGDALGVLNGISVLLDSEASAGDKTKAAVDTTTGTLGLVGAGLSWLGKAKEIAWASRVGGWTGPLGVSIAVTYYQADMLAKHVYSPVVTATTEHGLQKSYQNLHRHLRELGKQAIICEHWMEQWMEYLDSDDPADQIKAEMAKDRLAAVLPMMQYELHRTLYYALNERYDAISEPFRNSNTIMDNQNFVTMEPGPTPEIVAMTTLNMTQEVFNISTKLYADYKKVLESAAKQNMEYYKKNRMF